MSTNAILQYMAIGCIVAFSALRTIKHFAPSVWRQGVRAIALRLESINALPMLARWGSRLHAANAVGAASASACASSGSCSSCGSCASSTDASNTGATIVMTDPVMRRR